MTRLLPALASLFWGWNTQSWITAGALALALALPQFLSWRWIPDARQQRLALLLSLIDLLVLVLLAVSTGSMPASLFQSLRWLPLAFAPAILMQAWSPGGVFSPGILRALPENQALDLRPAFVLCVLLAAAAANTRDVLFLPLAAMLLVVLAWPLRRRGLRLFAWTGCVLAALALAFALQLGLSKLQDRLESGVIDWLTSLALDMDADRAITRIGEMGRLKVSSKVLLRVVPDPPSSAPLLLMQAAYDRYTGAVWLHSDAQKRSLAAHDGEWLLDASPARGPSYLIEARLENNRGVLPLPIATSRLALLRASAVERSANSAVKVFDAPDFLRFRARTGAGSPTAPQPGDLEVPRSLLPALRAVWREIGTTAKSDVPAAVQRFFYKNYRYSLELQDAGGRERSLERFLLGDRAGHCEYFASATVLLLRAAGIPARYAVGFAAYEADEDGAGLLVRAHDAHAWAIAWNGKAWREVDSTPPDWSAFEAGQAPWWRGLFAKLGGWEFVLARHGAWLRGTAPRMALALLGTVVLFFLARWAWRRLRQPSTRRTAPARAARRDFGALAPALRLLERQTPWRGPQETLRSWTDRALRDPAVQAAELLRASVRLDYQLRYDPLADREALAAQLAAQAQAWVAAQKRSPTPEQATSTVSP